MKNSILFKTIFFLLSCMLASGAWAHGFVGQRFFPATITIDDPFAGDEFDLSTFWSESPGDNGGRVWTLNPIATWSKRITPLFQYSLAASYLNIHNPPGQANQDGFDNLVFGLLYEVYLNPDKETIISLGLNASIGGTGAARVGATSYYVWSPLVLFGQGFGALSDKLKYLRPFAVTGTVQPNFQSGYFPMTSVFYGMTLMYSFPYFQAFVHSTSYKILNHLIPIVEVPLSTCTTGPCGGQTTGTVNPGLITVWKYGQVSAEAIIPINSRSGNKTGVVFQLHLFFDDLFAKSFLGKPIFS